MIVFSAFNGMNCGRIALEREGIKVSKYYASEIDKYANQVTQENYPDTIQLGDIRNIKDKDLDKIDLFIGGSPCQGFSFAGKQLNFNDERSALFFEYVRLWNEIKEINPEAKFLLENVNMKKEYLRIISEYLGIFPVRINSNLVSAQNRDRWYWTNIRTKETGLFSELWSDIPQPKDKSVFLKDILQPESEVDEKYYLNGNYFDWWNKNKKFQLQKKYSQLDGDKSLCQTARQYASWNGQYITHNLQPRNGKGQGGKGHLSKNDNRTYCIDTRNNQAIEYNNKIRKLTPIECERLQTVPDNYTSCVSDTQRYKMLGNGWTVDIIAHIFSYLK